MFELVNDFESYPQFLPWCESTRLISRTKTEMCAELTVGRVGIRQTFSTCNQLVENERVDIHLRNGPFHKLQGGWVFTPLREDACKIELVLEFEFSGRLIDKAFGAFFNQIANTLVDAFCKRADEVYGGGKKD
jgi:ribosome-associated toxin RatA of RatAB toxin-antitoxin module